MKHICKSLLAGAVVILCAACSSLQPVKERIEVDLNGQRFPAGKAEAEFDKAFTLNGLVKLDLALSYYPAESVSCLQFRHNFTTYYQFWSKTNREAFIGALEQYKQDYVERTLTNSNMRTKRQYGVVRGHLIWETSQYSTQGRNHPNIEIGYQFKQDAPYFTLTMREESNEDDITKDGMPSNENIVIYFTRAQAETLAALFAVEYLSGLGATPAETAPGAELGSEPYEEGSF